MSIPEHRLMASRPEYLKHALSRPECHKLGTVLVLRAAVYSYLADFCGHGLRLLRIEDEV
jgi:hypothetical protein